METERKIKYSMFIVQKGRTTKIGNACTIDDAHKIVTAFAEDRKKAYERIDWHICYIDTGICVQAGYITESGCRKREYSKAILERKNMNNYACGKN